MPQKHEVPGSNPGWGTRFFRASECARACSFTTWMWQRRPRRAATQTRVGDRRAARRGGAGFIAVRVRISLPVPPFPSSKGEDRGPSRRVCRFKSGRERQRGRRFESRRLHQFHLAVAQRAARVVRGDEDAGSNPAGETINSPVAQRTRRARGYEPRGRGFESLPGCQWRRSSVEKSTRLSSGRPRVRVPPASPIFPGA